MMPFSLNTILSAVLFALIVGKVTGIIAANVISPEPLKTDAYPIAGAAAPAAASAPTAPAEAKPDPIPAAILASANPDHGQEIAQKCAQCHNFAQGAGAKVGPNLWDVINRPRASAPGFSYSDALKALGGTWTVQDIAAFIYKPAAYAKGTKMAFPGLPKPQDRADVLAYLNKESDHPVDLAKAD